MAITKVQITVDSDLLARVDSFADSMFMSRSGFFSFAAVKYLNENQLLNGFTRLVDICGDIAKNQTLTDEQKKNLEELEQLSSLVKSYKPPAGE